MEEMVKISVVDDDEVDRTAVRRALKAAVGNCRKPTTVLKRDRGLAAAVTVSS